MCWIVLRKDSTVAKMLSLNVTFGKSDFNDAKILLRYISLPQIIRWFHRQNLQNIPCG